MQNRKRESASARRRASDVSEPHVAAAALTEILANARAVLHDDKAAKPLSRSEVRAATRVVPKALTLAARILASSPERFAAFDAKAVADAAAYVEAMLPVLRDAERFVSDLHAKLLRMRLPASKQTLALHATLNALRRVRGEGAVHELANELAAEIDRRPKKPRMSKGERAARSLAKDRAKKIAKQKAKLAELQRDAVTIGRG